ncbi:hypothetical protein D9M69_456340 [compost metagenome]
MAEGVGGGLRPHHGNGHVPKTPGGIAVGFACRRNSLQSFLHSSAIDAELFSQCIDGPQSRPGMYKGRNHADSYAAQ